MTHQSVELCRSIATVTMPLLVLCLSLAAPGTSRAQTGDPATERCNLLATGPDDLSAGDGAAPTPFVSLRAHAADAIEACSASVEANPELWRSWYQLGRAQAAADNDDQAAEAFTRAAEAGYPAAMNTLGVLLDYGRGVPRDTALSFGYIQAAAEAGDVLAMANLGILLVESGAASGVEGADLEASMKWLTEAADRGDALAMNRLAWNYGMGDGGAQPDKEKGFYWVDEALERGEESADYIAMLLAYEHWEEPELLEKYRDLLVTRGTRNRLAINALNEFGYTAEQIRSYRDIGFRFDRPEEEAKYVTRAIFDRDELLVEYVKANLPFLEGETKTAATEFIDWFNQNHTASPNTVADIVLQVDQDAAERFTSLPVTECDILTSSDNDIYAVAAPVSYAQLREHARAALSACELAPETARTQYHMARALLALGQPDLAAERARDAARQGYPAAMTLLGVLIDHGRVVVGNSSESVDWFEKAARAGDPVAATNLALAYLWARNTQADPALGTAWLIAAAKAGDPLALVNLGAAEAQSHWNLDIRVSRASADGVRKLTAAFEQGEPEAAYLLHGIVIHEIGVLSELDEDQRAGLRPPAVYERAIDLAGDRRKALTDGLRAASTYDGYVAVIAEVVKMPHRVDRVETEPLYVVDAYLDNDHALAELMRSQMMHEDEGGEITSFFNQLSNSDRSFGRMRQ